MRPLFALLLLTTAAVAQTPAAQLAADDAVRIREFYRLASQIQNQIWPGKEPDADATATCDPGYRILDAPRRATRRL